MSRTFLTMVCIVAVASGCARSSATMVISHPRVLVGVSLISLRDPTQKGFADNIGPWSSEDIEYRVISCDADAGRQVEQIKGLIAQKAIGLIVWPCDGMAISSALREANQAGIPIVTVEVRCADPRVPVVTHVATDHARTGREAAQAMLKSLATSGGKVTILGRCSTEVGKLRVQGIHEAIQQHNRKNAKTPLVIVDAAQDSKGSPTCQTIETLLKAQPDLAGIFTIEDACTRHVRAALGKLTGAERVQLVGIIEQREIPRPQQRFAVPNSMPAVESQGELLAQAAVDSLNRSLARRPAKPEILLPADPRVLGNPAIITDP